MSWHASLPWARLRLAYRRGRSRFFSVPRPDRVYLEVDRTPAELEVLLGGRSFAPNWEFSYDKGEDINLARVLYAEDDSADHGAVWWQLHVRGWEHEGSTRLSCHWEPEPTEHPVEHLHAEGWNRPHGMDELAKVLTDLGVEYGEVDWPR